MGFNPPMPVDEVEEEFQEIEETDDDDNEENCMDDGEEVIFDVDEDIEDEDEVLEDDPDDGIEVVTASSVKKYKDSLFVCALSPDLLLAAVGSEDDHAYLIDTTDQKTLHTIKHEDSVTFVSFSKDGKYLATGDMKGNIKAVDVTTFEKIWETTITEDLQWLCWHNFSNTLIASNTIGEVWMWKIPSGKCKLVYLAGIQTQAAALFPDGKRIAVGYDDGMIRVLDLKACTVLQTTCISKSSPVVTISCHKNNTLVIAGTEDGTTKSVHAHNGKITATFKKYDSFIEVADFSPHSSTSVVIGHSFPSGGSLVLFESNNPNSPTTEIENVQCTNIVWHPTEHLFYVGCIGGKIRCYNGRTGKIQKIYGNHTDDILSLDVRQQGNVTKLISASDDKCASIFII